MCVVGKGLMNDESLEGTQVVLEKYQDDFVSDINLWQIDSYKDSYGNPTEWFLIMDFHEKFCLAVKDSETLNIEGMYRFDASQI